MSRVIRAAVAQEVGQSLRELGIRLQRMKDNYVGESLENERESIANVLSIQLSRLEQLIESCREARNSYPNYPSLRKAIADAGDVCYDLRMTLLGLRAALGVDNDHSIAVELLKIGQQIKSLSFVAPSREKAKEVG